MAIIPVATLDHQRITVALVTNDGTGLVVGVRVRNSAGYPARVILDDDGGAPEVFDTPSTGADVDHVPLRQMRPPAHASFRTTIQPVPGSA
jgi:hypothetical protein